MNKLLTKIATAFVGMAMAVGVGVGIGSNERVVRVNAETTSWDMTTESYSSASASIVTWTSLYATMTLEKAESSTNANNYLPGTNNHLRVYKDQLVTFTPSSGYQINNVTITSTGTSYVAGWTGGSQTNCSASSSSTTITVTPATKTSAFSLTLSAAARANNVVVDYQTSGGDDPEPPTPTPTPTPGSSYQKVTSALDDWSGNYLLVYENSATSAYCWTGVDATSCYAEATISSNNIEKPESAVILTIAAMTGGYSIQVNGGTNDGKYTANNGSSNGIRFYDTATANTLTYENSAVTITCGGKKFRYNSDAGNNRFRYFGSDQKVVQLYKEAETKATVKYDLNGGSGDVPADTEYDIGDEVTIASSTGLTRPYSSFVEWNTKNDGTGDSYAAGAVIESIQSSLTLYAIWEGTHWAVSYNANGGSDAPETQYVEKGQSLTLNDGAGITAPTNKVIDGWATTASGEVVYSLGQTGVTPEADMELFAHYVWNNEPAVVDGLKISELESAVTADGEKAKVYSITGYVVGWYNDNTDGTKYGNFYISDNKGDTEHKVLVYGANANNPCVWNGSAYEFTNNQDFLTNNLTKDITLKSKITAVVMGFTHSTTFELQGSITSVANETNVSGISASFSNTSPIPITELNIASSDSDAHTVYLTLTPSNSTHQELNISSKDGDPSVVTISDSSVTAVNGSATFTVTGKGLETGVEHIIITAADDISLAVEITINAVDKSIDSVRVDGTPVTQYQYLPFNPEDLTFYAHYNTGEELEVDASQFTFSPATLDTTGDDIVVTATHESTFECTIENVEVVTNVLSIELEGDLSRTSFGKSEEWNHNGITATGTYASTDPYTGDFEWKYKVNGVEVTPADLDEGEYELSITASASGQTSNAKVVTVTITKYADVYQLAGLNKIYEQTEAEGTKRYLDLSSASTSVHPSANELEDKGSNVLFELVADNTFKIKYGSNYLYTTNSNDGVRLGPDGNDKDNKWVVDNNEVLKGETPLYGDYNFKSTVNNRYLCVYNGADWRTYTSINASNRTAKIQVANQGAYPNDLVISGEYKTEYYVGQAFDPTGLVINVKNSDGTVVSSPLTTADYSVEEKTFSAAGSDKVKITANYLSFTLEKEINVTVIEDSVTGYTVVEHSAKENYYTGDELDISTLVVKENYASGKTPTDVESSRITIEGFDSSVPASGQELTVKVDGTAVGSYFVNITEAPTPETPVLDSITAVVPDGVKTFNVGDTFSHEGVVVTAHYTLDKEDADVSSSADLSFYGYNMDEVGTQTVTIKYIEGGVEKTTTYQITVKALPVLDSITLTVPDEAKAFTVGDTFSHEGVVVTAHYTEGKADAVVTGATFSNPDMSTKGEKTITVSYTEGGVTKTATYKITVQGIPSLDKLVIDTSGMTLTVAYGEQLDTSALVATAKYTEGKADADVSNLVTITGFDPLVEGKQTVSVSYTEGGITKTATFTVTVGANPKALTGIAVNTSAAKTTYTVGDEFSSEGVVITATYKDQSSKTVTGATFTGYNMNTAGTQTVTVTYTEGGVTKTATYQIVVKEAVKLTGISVDATNAKTTYTVGDTFSSEGVVVTATYSDGTSKVVTGATFSSPNMSTAGRKEITVSYTEGGITKTAKYEVVVNPEVVPGTPVLDSITLDTTNAKTEYNVGDRFSSEGVVVTANYTEGKASAVVTGATFSGYNMNTAGTQTVTVTYTEDGITQSKTYTIVVNAVAKLDSITLDTTNAKTTYTVGDTFSSEGVVVTANYTEGKASGVVTGATFSAPDMSTAGRKTITVTYVEDGVTKTATYTITVANPTIAVTGVTLDKETASVEVGQTVTLTATVAPADATNKAVTWSSSDTSIATVRDGVVTGVKAGTVTITVTTVDGNKTATCTITVTGGDVPPGPGPQPQDPTLTSIAITTNASKTTFIVNEAFSSDGLVVTATYSDGSTKVVEATVTAPDMSTAGTKTVTITYTENGETQSTSYTITVNRKRGCRGDITTTSIILSSFALAGIALVLLKKKKETR